MPKTFLQAEWRKLAIANYAVNKEVLQKYIPHKTEIDLWENTCYVSLVGFMFLNTKLLGFKIPFHINFEEVNLRFYVRYKDNGEWRRGVVFIKEIVPKYALTLVANTFYNERYETMKMKHLWLETNNELKIEYAWQKEGWHSLRIIAENKQTEINNGSEEEFITEHFWGYTQIQTTKTSEYGVEHPRWKVYPVKYATIDVNFKTVYGEDFSFLTNQVPKSVFLAEGSEIQVKTGRSL